MKSKYHVKLTDEERKALQEVMLSEEAPITIKKRCSILLLTDENAGTPSTQREISKRCDVAASTIYSTIMIYSTQGLEQCLRRRQHETPPNPPIATGEIEASIVALACSEAPEGRTRWTVRLLTERIIELNIVETISRETVRRLLKKHKLCHTR